jgi:hypothetical protein
MNGEWRPHIENQVGKRHNAHLVHWLLERPAGSGGLYEYARSNRQYLYDRLLDDVWVSDRGLASETLFRHVILGSHHGLGEPGDEKKYDFCHMSYPTDRRLRVYNHFHSQRIGPNCWPWDTDPSRDDVLRCSRFALNIHQDSYPFQEPLRLALFAAYGLPILTESINDAYPWNEDTCVFHGYDGIQGRLQQMLKNDYGRWKDMGRRARDMMCDTYGFRKMVLAAIKETGL